MSYLTNSVRWLWVARAQAHTKHHTTWWQLGLNLPSSYCFVTSCFGSSHSTVNVANKTSRYLLKRLNLDTSESKLRCSRENSADDIATLPAPANVLHGVMRDGVYLDELEIKKGFYDRSNAVKKFGDNPVIIHLLLEKQTTNWIVWSLEEKRHWCQI